MASEEAIIPKESTSSSSLETANDVERIFLRLVHADTDVKLQSVTDRHLCDILELADRKTELVNLISEFLNHFNKVVRSNLAIRLPVSQLIKVFEKNGACSSNLSLIYLKYAKERMDGPEQLKVLPIYMKYFSKKPTDLNYIYDVFTICFPGFHELAGMERKDWPKIEISSTDAEILARCFQAVLTFSVKNFEVLGRRLEQIAGLAEKPKIPGLCVDEFIHIGKKLFHENLNLAETKMMILKLLGKELLEDKVAFPLIVVATASRLNEVDDLAQGLLKKIPTENLVNERSVVDKLMYAYLGSEALTTKPGKAELLVAHGDEFSQAAVLTYLSKSKIAPIAYMNNVKVCLHGCESPSSRVQVSTMHFFQLVVEQMPDKALKLFAAVLFKKLFELLPRPENAASSSPNKVALCGIYRCLSVLGIKHPDNVLKNWRVAYQMFISLDTETVEDVASAIAACLISWIPLFAEAKDQELRQKTTTVISEIMMSKENHARMVAMKYAEVMMGDGNTTLLWNLIRSAGDNRDTIRSEAFRQLEKSLEKHSPHTSSIIEGFWKNLHPDFPPNKGEGTLPLFNILIHQAASRYLYGTFETKVMGEPAHLRIVDGDDHWITVAPRIVKLLHGEGNAEKVRKAAEIALFSAINSTDVHLVRIASCFIAAYRSFPQHNSGHSSYPPFQYAVQQCSQKLRDSTRMEYSIALTYLLSILLHEDQVTRVELFNSSKSLLIEKEIPGLSFTCAAAITPVLGAQFIPPVGTSEFIMEVFLPLIKNGYHRPTSALESTLGALYFVLQNNTEALDQKAHSGIIISLIENCEKIAVSRQDSFTQKTREFSAKVIGLLGGRIEDDESSYEHLAQSLNRIGQGPPQQELQMVVGEAIVDSILGNLAMTKRDFNLVDGTGLTLVQRLETDVRLEIVNKRLIKFITETLEHKKTNANQHFRKAELIWLLIVIQNFANLKAEVLKKAELLRALQQSFADGLTENDEFSQDISAKGMGVVYGLADGSLKKGLVESLMNTLSEGKRSETKLEKDTKLFEAGQLGTTPTGGKLTTYQELLTLASDLNQPDLVYKFMQLARHNATWNSKMGAAHGFGALLENAKEELEPYFKQLVPKLFRFRYDPDVKVQNAMRSIWGILTADRKNVVDEFANEISKELLPALTDREYRVRESACLALSDLFRGHDTVEMHQLIPEYLEAVLRVRDDVKESVREAANRAADAIAKLIVRLGSSSNLEKANRFLSVALPAIIDQGILKSTVKSNMIFCLSLVLELTKSAGKQLKPYMADLIPILMDAVSENETPLLNYLAARSDQHQIEMLDDARASLARSSPMMTAVNDLLPHIDSEVLIKMTPRVAETLRSSVGTSTRSSAAQFVTQLALRAPQLLHDHTAQCDKLFAALIPGVRDRNPSIRKQFANAMSYLAKYSSSNQMKKLIKTVVADLTGSDEELKVSSCHVISNLAANSSEVLEGYTSQIVPYVLLEKCREVPKGDDVAREKQEKWNDVWSELVPSTSAAARLYKSEILELAMKLVTNNEVWAVRKQAAVMIGVLFETLKSEAGIEIAKKSAFCLLQNLNGRLWDGKVEILKALTKTFEAGGIQFVENLQSSEAEEIVKVLRREASKKNADYACAGLSTLAAWSVITKDIESANWLAEKVDENVTKLTSIREGNESDDNMDGLSNLEKEIRASQLVTLNLTALAISLATFNTSEQAQKSLNQVAGYVNNNLIAWKSKQFFFNELVKTIENWHPEETVNAEKLITNLLEQADDLCAQQKKTVAADALQVVLRTQNRSKQFGVDWETVIDRVMRGTAGQITGLGSRFEIKMEID
ncbi:hypothetical protein GCK72_010469 [Caenorhabditis remanei]|uniref:Uncharacterized protein n=1 Tax=Caenorhabditis remanei TaxID=31234 RepID=A0A6A5H4V1_CAERE|nr:hypothetical protein GCK72_010469 [Caenorhabditis remanei]KAF1762207.1 hypothetical protein GCK72_010469 [Caenorhabditis remanei]